LLNRNYDKVVHVSREVIDLSKALAKYHRKADTIEDVIKLAIDEPKFFNNIKKKHEKLHKDIQDSRFYRFSLFDWDNHTKIIFNELLDFLEFPKDRNVLLLVAKPEGRNFEGYSCDHIDIDQPVCENVERCRETGN
jgi:Ca2+-binding EF-hand superfamily protein